MVRIYHLWNIWFHEAQFNVFWLVAWNWIANPNTLLILGGPAIPLFLYLVDFIYQIILSSVQALLLLIVVVVNDIVLTPTYTWTKGCFDKDKALNFEAYYDPECGTTTLSQNFNDYSKSSKSNYTSNNDKKQLQCRRKRLLLTSSFFFFIVAIL